MMNIKKYSVLLVVLLASSVSAQNVVYITEKLEIPLRKEASIQSDIQMMLPTGKKMELLERLQTGWVKVNVDGKIGWVIASYVSNDKPILDRYNELKKDYDDINIKHNHQTKELTEMTDSRNQFRDDSKQLRLENMRLQREKEHMEETYKDSLSLEHKNQQLVQENLQLRSENQLYQQNSNSSDDTLRTWFLVGGLVLFAGVILGFIISRIGGRRRISGY